MANLNKVSLIGRLTRDVEVRTFNNGGKVAKLGFAVNNRVKNQSSGEWEDKPVWLDVKLFDRENGRKLASLAEQYLHKGDQTYIEGHLVLEEWEKDGQKRSRLVIVADDVQFLEPKKDGQGNGAARPQPASRPAPAKQPTAQPQYADEPSGEEDEQIPF